MINLLPDAQKDAIRAARANVILVRYISIIALAFAFISGALYFSYTVLTTTMANADNLIASNDIKADVYSDTRQQVSALSAKLSDTKRVLDQEVRYSEVLVELGQLMPRGTILGDFTLEATALSGQPTDIKAYAKSTAEASVLQNNFQNSPLFRSVNLKGTETSQNVDGYPVEVSMSVIFNRGGM